jgi:hypothetical protein
MKPGQRPMEARFRLLGCRPESFDALLDNWIPLTYVVNSINRSMGVPDMYPFVMSIPAIDKLRFVHEVIGTRPRQ